MFLTSHLPKVENKQIMMKTCFKQINNIQCAFIYFPSDYVSPNIHNGETCFNMFYRIIMCGLPPKPSLQSMGLL